MTAFHHAERIRGVHLAMRTDFDEVNFPEGTGSPTSRVIGITIAIGAVTTLALLMILTAKVNRAQVFTKKSAMRPIIIPAGE